MNKFKGLLLLTDLDGTLLRNDKSVSVENLDAIEYFKQEGGTFTVVSGRAPVGMEKVMERLGLTTPVGCFNGGGIYDPVKKTVSDAITIPPAALALADYAGRAFPKVGIEIFTTDHVWFCKTNRYTEKHRTDEYLPLITCTLSEIKAPITKILFAADTAEIGALAEALSAHPDAKDYTLVQSDPNYYEILPRGISKAISVQGLSRLMGFDTAHMITVGDNDNDVAMLKMTEYSYAVANGTPAAKAAAKRVTVSNEEHALAAVIRDLEALLCR